MKELVRFKYACKKCQEGVVITDLPPQPIERGIPGPGLLAHVLTSKYCDHVPLNRLVGIFSRNGIDLSRQTLCDWVGKTAPLLAPLREFQRKELISSNKIHTDDTVVPVLEKDRRNTKQGRLWVYGNDTHIVYDYTPNRSREGPKAFLKGYREAFYVQVVAQAPLAHGERSVSVFAVPTAEVCHCRYGVQGHSQAIANVISGHPVHDKPEARCGYHGLATCSRPWELPDGLGLAAQTAACH